MAKHLIEGRAFPLFYYGQHYMLGVEAYLAAPVFLVAGISVATLKFPLLVLNVAAALLLLRILQRDVGLRPWVAGCRRCSSRCRRPRSPRRSWRPTAATSRRSCTPS